MCTHTRSPKQSEERSLSPLFSFTAEQTAVPVFLCLFNPHLCEPMKRCEYFFCVTEAERQSVCFFGAWLEGVLYIAHTGLNQSLTTCPLPIYKFMPSLWIHVLVSSFSLIHQPYVNLSAKRSPRGPKWRLSYLKIHIHCSEPCWFSHEYEVAFHISSNDCCYLIECPFHVYLMTQWWYLLSCSADKGKGEPVNNNYYYNFGFML